MTTDEVNLPSYYRVLETPDFDTSSIGVKVHKIECSNNNQTGLNNNQVKKFVYVGDQKCIRLHPFLSGFRVRAGFKTQTPVATDESTANITLANNWFWHLWSQFKLKVANQNDLELISNIGEFCDIMAHFRGDELKRTEGQLNGYIPDEGSGLAVDVPVTVTNAQVLAAANTPANFSTVANANYNLGFHKRKQLYNYTCADGDIRYVEQFFPLWFSGFFNTDTCLMNTSFEIELTRKSRADYRNAVFGDTDTDIVFAADGTETGLLSVTLELYEQTPEKIRVEPSLLKIFGDTNKEPKPLAYLKASCTNYQWGLSDKYTISETSYHVPRYVFIGVKGMKGEGNAAANLAVQENLATGNWSLFSHADIQSVKVTINGQAFPVDEQDANFLKNQYSIFYQSYVDTCRSLPYSGSVSLDMSQFRDLYPIFAFNCESQEPKISTNTTNLKVELKRRARPAANTDRKNPQNPQLFMVALEDQYALIDAVRSTCNVYSKPV